MNGGTDNGGTDGGVRAPTPVRPALDAHDSQALTANPSDEDAKLDVALDETFPTSDPPANVQPGKGLDPAPSTGFNPDAEAERQPS
jgi:hypothetical protein